MRLPPTSALAQTLSWEVNSLHPASNLSSTDYAQQAYGAACMTQANVFLPTNFTSLSLPDSWDGPFVGILPLSAAVFYAIFGGILGLSALYILSVV
jgi:hypothetical protein